MAASDRELLERWGAGDRAAGDALFERHFTGLFRFFRSKVDDAAAEDLTQATFLACVAGRDRFRAESSMRTYLFAIARKQLLMHYRKRSRNDRVIVLDSVSVAELGGSPSEKLGASEEQRLLLSALRRIPVDFQIAIELYYWEGLAVAELAEVLEIAEGTVRSRLARARERLAAVMGDIAESPALAQATISGFEHWARELREALHRTA
jgi:RNA polymerase sigma-70 factor (ECF subfamily)